MNPANSTIALADRKSVLVPGLIVTVVNPLGLDAIPPPDAVTHKNLSTLIGKLGMYTLPEYTLPKLIGVVQSEVVESNTCAIPPEIPKDGEHPGVTIQRRLLSNPLDPKMGYTTGRGIWVV